MNKQHEFFAETLEPIHDPQNAIYLDSGVPINLHLATRPMILALRKKHQENPHSLLITQRGIKFLFRFPGYQGPDLYFSEK